jgi:hypothetical protein
MRSFIDKLKSRKFLACIAGVATGIALIATGNTIEGAASVIASVVGYIAAEGYVDGKAVKNTIEATQKVLDETMKNLDNIEEGEQNDRT